MVSILILLVEALTFEEPVAGVVSENSKRRSCVALMVFG
jgi:hypothetical protein